MTRRFNDLLIMFFLALGVALAPIACGNDNGDNDGGVNNMTPG
jgi:hypothetical protein